MSRWFASATEEKELEGKKTLRSLCEQLTLHGIVEGKFYTRTLLVRVMTAIMIGLATATLTIMTYILMTNQEVRIVEEQYEVVVAFGSDGILKDFEQRVLATRTLARLYGSRAPDVSLWPNVTDPSFDAITNAVLPDAMTASLSFAPIVLSEERAAFQHFAYDFFDSNQNIPTTAGKNLFGNGIFKYNPRSDYADGRDPDFDGVPDDYTSRYSILAPVLQQTRLGDVFTNSDYMFNTHSSQQLGDAMDRALECVRNSNTDEKRFECATLSETAELECFEDCDGYDDSSLVTVAIVEVSADSYLCSSPCPHHYLKSTMVILFCLCAIAAHNPR